MRPRVRFKKPPVIEVVFGVLFNDLPKFKAPHSGLFWSMVRDRFPIVEERMPVGPAVEPKLGEQAQMQVQLLTIPPLPRVWLQSGDQRNLIQLQRDRFLYNWKRASGSDEYPSYDRVVDEFDGFYNLFRKFVRDEQLGEFAPRQYELVYVNHIGPGNGLDLVGPEGILVDHLRDQGRTRFLPEANNFNWRTVYSLPDEQGRLHVSAQTGTHTVNGSVESVVRLEMLARGFPSDASDDARRGWFSLAHDWITYGFADATVERLQREMWERIS